MWNVFKILEPVECRKEKSVGISFILRENVELEREKGSKEVEQDFSIDQKEWFQSCHHKL